MPKRKIQEAPRTPTKQKGKGKAVQASISTFLSPSKRAKRDTSVVVLTDSDDDIVEIVEAKEQVTNGDSSQPQAKDAETESDEAMARRLAAEWAAEEQSAEAEEESAPATAELKADVKEEPEPPLKPVHPMFARPPPASPTKHVRSVSDQPAAKNEPVPGPSRPRAPPAQPVDPVDFDMDSLLFQPSSIDTSGWPDGRLPYSILVGVYCQVAATRSRIIIVRVLTK